MRRKKLLILAALAAAGAAYMIFSVERDSAPEREERPESRGVAVRASLPGKGLLQVTRTFTGEVSGTDQARIYSEAPGRLRSYLVTEGEDVRKDQVIALVDREVTGIDFEQLRVRSPIDGTVTRLYLGRGDTVNQQTPLAVAAELDTVKVSFHIPEKDLRFVSRESPAFLRVSALPGERFEGKVSRIALSLERGSRSAYAEARFKNPGRALKPGMFAELEVVSSEIPDAITIPENAAVWDPVEECFCVFVIEDGRGVKRPVEIGHRQNDIIQIESGISATDRVIVEGQEFLEDSQQVREIE